MAKDKNSQNNNERNAQSERNDESVFTSTERTPADERATQPIVDEGGETVESPVTGNAIEYGDSQVPQPSLVTPEEGVVPEITQQGDKRTPEELEAMNVRKPKDEDLDSSEDNKSNSSKK